MIALKQSTASQEICLGYFLDDTDGKTAETGLTIANTDIKLWVNGATTLANKNSGGGTHISGGIYYATLDATDTSTVGPMIIFVHVSGALPVRLECHVYEEAIYDALFGASAAGFDANGRVDVGSWLGTAVTTSSTTNKPEVDAYSFSDDATAANNAELAFDGTGYGFTGCTVPTVTTLTGHTAQTGDSYARLGAPAGASVSADVAAIKAETALIVADTNELQTDDVPGLIAALNDPTAASIADAVWDEAAADHETADTTGALLQEIHQHVEDIAVTGSALNKTAESATITTGTPTATYTNTLAEDQTYHQVAESGNTLDFYYQFDIGESGVPVEVIVKGRLDEGSPPSGNDTVDVYAYDWDGTTWEHISPPSGDFTGVNGSTSADDEAKIMTLFPRHVGTGGDLGKVRIRLEGSSLESGTEMYVDQIYISYASVAPTAAAVADAVWDEAASGHTTGGTFGEQCGTDIDAILTDTADMQPKLGTPAADISADIAAVKVDTAATLVDTGTTLPATLGTPAGADMSADIAAVKVDTAATLVDTGTTLPATLTTIEGKVDTVDTVVDGIAADLPGKITKNTALSNFEFLMVLSSDHVTGATGKTVTATRSIDGAAFGACANSVSEVASGIYKIDLAASDLNGDTITLKFSEGTCDDRLITIVTQAT